MINRQEAINLLSWAQKQNPGPWVEHSYGVARAAEAIANNCGLNEDMAWVMGALHDIGRYEGRYGLRHIVAGYNLLMEKHEADIAKICITHSFVIPDINSYCGVPDVTSNDISLINDIIGRQMDDYDRLIQLCDAISYGAGVCLMEKRLIDVFRRHGFPPLAKEKLNATFDLKRYFDNKVGYDIYKLFPEVKDNTFGF